MLCIAASAVPSRRTPFFVPLSDGTSMQVVLVGDESFHYLASFADGTPVVENEDGTYCLAPEQKASIESTWKERLAKRNAGRFLKAKKMTTRAFGHPSSICGKKKGLVILVNFPKLTMKAANTQEAWDRAFNQVGYKENNSVGSVHDYFYDQSYGQFDLDFDVIGPVTVAKTYDSYGKNDSNGNDKGAASMVIEACKLADKLGINFADYDWDGDGYVEQVFCIYAGYGEHAGASSNTIWPHEFELSSAKECGDGSGTLTLDNVKIDTYAVSCELNGTIGSTMSGIGTACHEFAHCLGLPDTYDTSYSGGYGMGHWDLLDAGSYNGPAGQGEVPAGFTAYERNFAGWLTYTELSSPCTVTDMPCIADKPVAYIIYNNNNRNEYFILENRQSTKWYKYANVNTGVSGMLAYHIDHDQTAWENNEVNNNAKHQRMSIIPAGRDFGDYDSSSGQYYAPTKALAQSQLFPGSKNVTTLDNTSHADCGGKLFNRNTDGTYYMNKPITNIKMASGLISFDFMGGTQTEAPKAKAASAVKSNTFTANWDAVTGADSYTIELKEIQEGNISDDLLIQENFEKFITSSLYSSADISAILDDYTSVKGWDGNKIYRSSKGIKLGSSSATGEITTPTLTAPKSHTVTVKIVVPQYSDTEHTATLSIGSVKKSVKCSDEAQVIVFSNVSSDFQVKYTAARRSYMSCFEVYDGEYTLEELESSDPAKTGFTLTVSDITSTSYTFTDLTGTDYRYRVKAKAGLSESEWSNTIEVSLSGASGIISENEDMTTASAEYFTLSGTRISKPTASGIYIVRRGGVSKKIIIK